MMSTPLPCFPTDTMVDASHSTTMTTVMSMLCFVRRALVRFSLHAACCLLALFSEVPRLRARTIKFVLISRRRKTRVKSATNDRQSMRRGSVGAPPAAQKKEQEV